MEVINTFGNDFKLDDKRKYYLALQLENKALLYTILDIEEKKYLGLKHFNLNSNTEAEVKESILKIVNEEPLFLYNFNEVIFQYQSFRGMLVPETLFDSKNLRVFLQFHHDIDDKDYVQFQEIKPAEAFVIFTVPVYLEEFLETKYPQIKYSHHSVPFIYNAIGKMDKEDTTPGMHIYFADDFFDVLIIRNNKIQLFNSFFYKKYTDVIFFVANILNLFSIKPDTSKIFISGQIDENSDLQKELEKMFKLIVFEKFNNDISYSENLSSLTQQRYVNLLNIYNCGL